MKYSLFTSRLFAQALDAFIYPIAAFIIATIIFFPIVLVSALLGADDRITSVIILIYTFSNLLILFALNVLHLYNNQSTWGYRIMKVKIVNSEDGKQLSLIRIAIRVIVKYLYYSLCTILAILIAHIYFMYLQKGERTIMDYITGTKAVKAS